MSASFNTGNEYLSFLQKSYLNEEVIGTEPSPWLVFPVAALSRA
jgi:hypothetical protein